MVLFMVLLCALVLLRFGDIIAIGGVSYGVHAVVSNYVRCCVIGGCIVSHGVNGDIIMIVGVSYGGRVIHCVIAIDGVIAIYCVDYGVIVIDDGIAGAIVI